MHLLKLGFALDSFDETTVSEHFREVGGALLRRFVGISCSLVEEATRSLTVGPVYNGRYLDKWLVSISVVVILIIHKQVIGVNDSDTYDSGKCSEDPAALVVTSAQVES